MENEQLTRLEEGYLDTTLPPPSEISKLRPYHWTQSSRRERRYSRPIMVQTGSRRQERARERRSRSDHNLRNQDAAQDRQRKTFPVSYHCTCRTLQAIHIQTVKPVEKNRGVFGMPKIAGSISWSELDSLHVKKGLNKKQEETVSASSPYPTRYQLQRCQLWRWKEVRVIDVLKVKVVIL